MDYDGTVGKAVKKNEFIHVSLRSYIANRIKSYSTNGAEKIVFSGLTRQIFSLSTMEQSDCLLLAPIQTIPENSIPDPF